jgi:hypothetical protein
MKKSILIVLSILVVSCGKNKNVIRLLEDVNNRTEKGDIDKMVIRSFRVDDSTGEVIKEDLRETQVYEFENHLLKNFTKNDGQNNPVEKITYSYGADNELIRQNKFTYVQWGDYKGECKLMEYRVYKYSNKKLIEMSIFGASGEVTGKEDYKYDEKDNLIEKSKSDTEGRVMKTTITWKENNQVEINTYNKEDGKFILIGKRLQTYDDEGNLKESINHFRYTESGLEYGGKILYGYDKDNNLTDEKSFERDNTLGHHIENKYKDVDDKGNWLKNTVYEDGRANMLIERVIEYAGGAEKLREDARTDVTGEPTNITPAKPSSGMPAQPQKNDKGVMSGREIELLLTGSGFLKAEALFGYYDDLEVNGFGSLGCALYNNKAIDADGTIKHVVLVIRFDEKLSLNWKPKATIDKVFIVSDGQGFHFGLTPMKVNNGKLQ